MPLLVTGGGMVLWACRDSTIMLQVSSELDCIGKVFLLYSFCCCDSQGTQIWSTPLSASGTCFTSWPTYPRTRSPSRKVCSARRKLPSPFLAPTPRMEPPWRGRVLLPLLNRGHWRQVWWLLQVSFSLSLEQESGLFSLWGTAWTHPFTGRGRD